MNEVKIGDLRMKQALEDVRCSLHEEQGRFLCAKEHHKLSDIEYGGDEKGTCRRICVYSIDHGPQLMAFLARFAGTLTG